ncbi:MAG: hypothetical protein IKY62_00880 [Clostridia bacterium]|nr:hypothetical protein [Clostridia bacterium]
MGRDLPRERGTTMTKIELMKALTEGAVVTAEMAEKAQEILAADAKAKEARKGKVSAKDQAKRDENAALATKVATEILGTEPMTATDVAAALGEDVKVQKASYICRLAVTMGLASVTEVKIPKKGTQKAYTIVG